MRKLLGVVILIVSFSGIVFLFWQKEMQYALPTPVPNDYKNIPLSSVIDLEGNFILQKKASYFHFFQPSCPCSRFNLKHYASLYRNFKSNFNFYLVVPPSADMNWTKEMVDLDIQVVKDKGNKLAKACGVYSTPQAAIIDKKGSLYYRGNYNKGRYCTSKNSNYTEIAMDAFIRKQPLPDMSIFATKAYGCSYYKDNEL